MHPKFDRDPMAKAECARQLRLTVAGRPAREAVRTKAQRLRIFCNSAPPPAIWMSCMKRVSMICRKVPTVPFDIIFRVAHEAARAERHAPFQSASYEILA